MILLLISDGDDEINDIRTRRIIGLFDSNLAPDEDLVDGLGYIPWGYEDAQAKNYYLERRSVSHFAGADPITGFSAGWYTEGNPAGGIALDPALFMTDQHSAQAELLVQAEASMGRGHRVIQGNQQLSGIDLSLKETQVCRSAGNGVTCTSTSEASSEPVVVWAPFNSTDTNSGETGRNELTDGVMRVGEYNEADDRVGTDDRRVDGHRTNPKLTAIYKSVVANSYLDISARRVVVMRYASVLSWTKPGVMTISSTYLGMPTTSRRYLPLAGLTRPGPMLTMHLSWIDPAVILP